MNVGEGPVELFVIRNYMVNEGGPRRQLYTRALELENTLLKRRLPKRRDVKNQLAVTRKNFASLLMVNVEFHKYVAELREKYRTGIGRWVRQTLRTLSEDTGELGKQCVGFCVKDPIGLASQLSRSGCNSHNLHESMLNKDRKSDLFARFTKHRCESVMSGLFEGTKEDVDAISFARNIMPALLYPFLFPRVAGCCVIRALTDYETVKLPEQQPGVEYSFPRQNLADSALTISRLELAPNCSCGHNRHKGTELCFPLGSSHVELDHTLVHKRFRANGAIEEFLHFESNHSHRVTNIGNKPARLLIVRFLE